MVGSRGLRWVEAAVCGTSGCKGGGGEGVGGGHDRGDESTHQILSYGLLFLTFYHFPYTADPLTSTAPTRPFPTIAQSPPTIPYTHCTIGLVPHRRPPI